MPDGWKRDLAFGLLRVCHRKWMEYLHDQYNPINQDTKNQFAPWFFFI